MVLAACFCFMSCHTMIIPVLAGFTGSLGGSSLLMGTIVGITNLVSIGFRIVSGPVADRIAKKNLSLWGALMMCAGCTACALTQGTGLLLAARIVHGIGFACCSLGLSTWFSMLLPREKLGSGMGIYGTVQATAMAMTDNTERGLANNTYLIGLDSGMALGPIIGGFLYGHVPAEYFYPCLMVTAVLSTIVYITGKRKLSAV